MMTSIGLDKAQNKTNPIFKKKSVRPVQQYKALLTFIVSELTNLAQNTIGQTLVMPYKYPYTSFLDQRSPHRNQGRIRETSLGLDQTRGKIIFFNVVLSNRSLQYSPFHIKGNHERVSGDVVSAVCYTKYEYCLVYLYPIALKGLDNFS